MIDSFKTAIVGKREFQFDIVLIKKNSKKAIQALTAICASHQTFKIKKT
jgi:late competence protein required for DNA uptake (superfamily II DNA/RNA helicase)